MPFCRVPRCKGNPMWGQRLSKACTLPSWKKSTSEWPATRTEVRPVARTSSNRAARTKLSESVSSGVTPFPSSRYCMTRTVPSPDLRCPCSGCAIFRAVVCPGLIADSRRLVYERIVGELLHQEVGDVCSRDVGAAARFQIQSHTVFVRPRPVGQYHGTYDDPLQIALPNELLLCLLPAYSSLSSGGTSTFMKNAPANPGSCLLSPTPHAVWHTKRRKPCSFIAAMMLAEPTETGPCGSPGL